MTAAFPSLSRTPCGRPSLRAAAGLRWELPRLLEGAAVLPGSRCLEIGTGTGWGGLGLARVLPPRTMVAARKQQEMSRERMPDDAQVSEGADAGYPSSTDCYVDGVPPDG